MKKLVVILLFAGFSASAVEVAAWRGETVTFRLGEKESLNTPPAGLIVKTGLARDVKYRVAPKKPEYAVVADRIEWTKKPLQKGPCMVSVAVAPGAKPGRHTFGDVTVRVVDRVLPPAKDWNYYLDLWQHPWAVARAAGVKPFSTAHYAAMKPLWETLAAAGQKTLTVTLLDLPWNHQCQDAYYSMVRRVRKDDGTWTFNYELLDAYVVFGKSCGLGPDIACYTVCPWGYKVRWENEKGVVQTAEARPGTPFFTEYWGPFFKSFTAHLKEKGWFKHTFISMDERSPEDMRAIVAFLKEYAPGLRIATAGNMTPEKFDGIELDSFSQALGGVSPAFLAGAPKRRAEGKVTTCYICCGPAKPNTFMDSELDEAFWCGFYPAAAGLDGLLRWAYNSWPTDVMTDASYGNWRSGDTFLVYPDGSPSVRFLALQDGIRQAEKFNILRRSGIRRAELDALAAKYDVKAALNKKPGDFKKLIEETRTVINK